MFLWNLWWLRHAIVVLHQSPFHTDFIFHPLGADLYLHTLTPARGLQALLLEPLVGLVAAHNLLFLSGFVIAGYGMCRLGRHLRLGSCASLLAGAFYAFSSYHFARGYGHFNLTEIQWFPLFFLFLVKALDGGRAREAILAAGSLLLIAYSDYYYLVYALLLTALTLLFRWTAGSWGRVSQRLLRASTRGEKWFRGLLLADLAALLLILASGGIWWETEHLRIRAVRLGRPMGLLLVLLGVHMARAVRRGWRPPARVGNDLRTMALIALVALAGFSPVLLGAAASADEPGALLAYSHDFSRGYAANVQSFLLPGTLTLDHGSWLARLWPPSPHLLESGIEGRNFLGLVPLALAALGVARGWRNAWVRFLALAVLVFFNLALGPTLNAGAGEYWTRPPRQQLLLYNLLAQLPLLGGARVPSRFSILVSFAIALLAGFGLERLRDGLARRAGSRAGALATLALAVAALVELHPGRFRGRALEVPPGYRVIASDTEPVSVLDVPLVWSSGRARWGGDEVSLFHQTVHRKPVFSGSVSRLPERRFDELFALPLVGTVMRIQDGCDPDPWLDDVAIASARDFAARTRLGYAVLRWDEPQTSGAMAAIARYLDAVGEWDEVHRDASMTVLRRRRSP